MNYICLSVKYVREDYRDKQLRVMFIVKVRVLESLKLNAPYHLQILTPSHPPSNNLALAIPFISV